jgi:acyl-CoA synthetase (AMP-forming)/AMP-acid ligase II
VIAESLEKSLHACGERPFLITDSDRWTYSDTHQRVNRLAAGLAARPCDSLACYLPDSPELIAIVLAAAIAGKQLLLLNRDFNMQQVEEQLSRLEIDLLISDETVAGIAADRQLTPDELDRLPADGAAALQGNQGQLLLLTSGTTDQPKCVQYDWSDLLAQVGRHRPAQDERWLLAYKLNHFAGIQMLAHILANGSTLVLARSNRVADAVSAMSEHRVSHVSSTPTFWRFALALLAGAPELPALRQITLGSEPVPAALLEQLAQLFPAARIVHIYALTEAGSCIAVSDGKPGLPQAVLDRPEDAAVRFRIVDGELQVKTRHGMRAYRQETNSRPRTADGWFATGDLVRIEQQRIHFMGRQSDTINVGGVKVHPLEVENVIAALPGIKLARVYGQDNPVVGQIVAVDLLPAEPGVDPEALEERVRAACAHLPRHSQPRSINVVERMATNNFKLSRRGS